jgi:hypothetical protein
MGIASALLSASLRARIIGMDPVGDILSQKPKNTTFNRHCMLIETVGEDIKA